MFIQLVHITVLIDHQRRFQRAFQFLSSGLNNVKFKTLIIIADEEGTGSRYYGAPVVTSALRVCYEFTYICTLSQVS